MAAEEWVVMAKHSDGSYWEIARPVVESSFDALQAAPADQRTSEMYTCKASKIDTWILIPEGDRPVNAALVNVLPDGSLERLRNTDPDVPAA